LETLPVEAWLLSPALDLLNCSRNTLVSLPDKLDRWQPLRRLRLDYNRLASLPEGLGVCAHLEELNISSNNLTDLPLAFGNLTALHTLLANHNSFPYVPSQVGKCTQLTKLWMRECLLGSSERPTASRASRRSAGGLGEGDETPAVGGGNLGVIGQLTNLTSLSLKSNAHLRFLPVSCGRCTSLTLLEVDDGIDFPGPEIRCRGLRDTLSFLAYILEGAERAGGGEIHLDAHHCLQLLPPPLPPPVPSRGGDEGGGGEGGVESRSTLSLPENTRSGGKRGGQGGGEVGWGEAVGRGIGGVGGAGRWKGY